jgi:hypothetical protein
MGDELEEIKKDIGYISDALDLIAEAVVKSEEQRLKDKSEVLAFMQRVIDIEKHNYRVLSDRIEDIKHEL